MLQPTDHASQKSGADVLHADDGHGAGRGQLREYFRKNLRASGGCADGHQRSTAQFRQGRSRRPNPRNTGGCRSRRDVRQAGALRPRSCERPNGLEQLLAFVLGDAGGRAGGLGQYGECAGRKQLENVVLLMRLNGDAQYHDRTG